MPRTLLVDDEAIVREVVTAQLKQLGHQVEVAVDVASALALVATSTFDWILIDQRLGNDDGASILPVVRCRSDVAQTRAVAISADLDDAQIGRLRDSGFDATLRKPFSIDELRAVVGACMADSALDDAAAMAIWGNADTVVLLRRMLRDELPQYRLLLADCVDRRDADALRDVLHRMKSSAGFCGAVPLTRFIDATPRDTWDDTDLLARYDAACAALNPVLAPL